MQAETLNAVKGKAQSGQCQAQCHRLGSKAEAIGLADSRLAQTSSDVVDTA
jgi:hypothetical protein